jgi:hypothetical protein
MPRSCIPAASGLPTLMTNSIRTSLQTYWSGSRRIWPNLTGSLEETPFSPAWMPLGESPARLPTTLKPSATNHITTTTTYITGAMTDIKRARPKSQSEG